MSGHSKIEDPHVADAAGSELFAKFLFDLTPFPMEGRSAKNQNIEEIVGTTGCRFVDLPEFRVVGVEDETWVAKGNVAPKRGAIPETPEDTGRKFRDPNRQERDEQKQNDGGPPPGMAYHHNRSIPASGIHRRLRNVSGSRCPRTSICTYGRLGLRT